MTTLTDVKEWSIGSGKTEVHLRWMSDNPDLVVSTTEAPLMELRIEQYHAQERAIRREIKKVFGWKIEPGNSESNPDGSESTGWWKANARETGEREGIDKEFQRKEAQKRHTGFYGPWNH